VVLTIGAHTNEVEDLPSATVEGGPHITLVYFGDTSLPPELMSRIITFDKVIERLKVEEGT
jgi:hypothetical protein